MQLRTTLKNRKRKIAVADAETDPFVHGRVPQPFLWGYYDGETYKRFDKTADFVGFLREQNVTVFAHNGGRFDWHYLLPFLDPFTKLLVINGRVVRFRFGKADCRDSFSILPESLEKLTGEKIKIDYSWFEARERRKHFPQIETYLKNDCVILHRLITAFIAKYGEAVTLASAAFKRFAKMQPENRDSVVTGRNPALHEMMKKFYFGGRTQAFETGVFKGSFNVWDINSAYPFAMVHNHPAGMEYTERGPDCSAPISPQSFYTIDATSRGALPVRAGIRLDFPIGRRRFNATGHEILVGLETGTLEIHNIERRIVFHESINFKTYVKHFWNLKKRAPKQSADYTFAKLFLNSLYGKMAANPEKYHNYMTVPNDCVLAAESDDWDLSGILPGGDALMMRQIPEAARQYYHIGTAASITGFVRAMLWRSICAAKKKGGRVLYCDTDSLLASQKAKPLRTGSKLGQWKLELSPNLVALAGRKLYAMQFRSADGKLGWKTASKGVQLSASEILRVARGGTVKYDSAAPTFSLTAPPSFISRVIRATSSTGDSHPASQEKPKSGRGKTRAPY